MVALLALTPWHIGPVGMYDEGIILTGALRVLSGDVPHRDFYANYGPAQFYVVAALLRLFDGSFLAVRTYDILIKAVICGMVFCIVRRTCRLSIALMMTAVVWLWFVGLGTHLYPVFPCVLLELAACWMLAECVGETSRAPLLSAAGGALAGLAALFRYDVGFLLVAANLLAAAIMLLLSCHVRCAVRRFSAIATAYIGGVAIVFVPFAAAYLSISPLQPFVHDIIRYPLEYYGRMRSLPFPALWSADGAVVYLPFIAIAVGLAEARRIRLLQSAGTADVARRVSYLVVFAIAAAVLSVKGLVRVSPVHMLLAAIPSLVGVAVVVDHWSRARDARRLAALSLCVFVVIGGASIAINELLQLYVSGGRSLATSLFEGSGPFGGRDGGGCAPLQSEPHARAAEYLRTHSSPDERIFVAVGRHDKIFVNSIALYFVANRLPATRWHHFDPGLQTRPDVQEQIIGELQQGRVRWIIRDRTFDNVIEPNESARSGGATLLDEYLAKAFLPVFSAGRVEVLHAVGQPVPAPRTNLQRSCAYAGRART